MEVQSIGVPDLGLDKINAFSIFYPSLKEQELIVIRLDEINKKIELEQTTLNKYQKLKQGLMQDLLTGKVTVSV